MMITFDANCRITVQWLVQNVCNLIWYLNFNEISLVFSQYDPTVSEWVEFNAPTRHNIGHFGGGLHSQSLDWYWQTKQYRKINIQKLNTNTVQENKHTKTKYKSNKADNLKTAKQNCPGSVASYDTRPGNEVGLFYNDNTHGAPKPTRGVWSNTRFA